MSSQLDRVLASLLAALPEDLDLFARLCSEVPDWSGLLARAGRHGVEGVLHHYVSLAGYRLTPDVAEKLEERRIVQRLQQAPLYTALDESLDVLNAAGIRTVALKGPVLGERLYPEPRMRRSTDLDFLVARTDLEAAVAALESIGYRDQTGPSARYNREQHHCIHLHRPRSPAIEMHFQLHSCFGRMPSDPVLSRAFRYETARGPVAWVLAPEDELLFLCLHAAGHCFARLSWLYEIKLLLHRHAYLDGTAVAARAVEAKVVTALWVSGEILRMRLGAALPVRHGLPSPNGVRWRIARFLLALHAARPSCGPLIPWISLIEVPFRAVLHDRTATGLQYLQHHLLRLARRRLYWRLPNRVPKEWSA
jgi:hypothetical protein